MKNFQLDAKCQLLIFVIFLSFSSVLCSQAWHEKLEIPPYVVLVKKVFTPESYTTSQGILLNDRYVLTAAQNIKVGPSLNSVDSVIVNFEGSNETNMKGKEYKILQIFERYSLALLRTEKIDLKQNRLRCLELPNSTYSEPEKIPNKKDFESTCWTKDNSGMHLRIRRGHRNCSSIELRNNKLAHLVPSCLLDLSTPEACQVKAGAPFVYREELVGMTNYDGGSVPSPYKDRPYSIQYDEFLNIALYKGWLLDVMIDYTSCEIKATSAPLPGKSQE